MVMTPEQGTKKNVIRALPFFFSGTFFVLFGVATILLIPAYFFFKQSIIMPLLVDLALVVAAIIDFRTGPSADKFTLERLLPYPLTVDRANEIPIEITNRTGRPVRMLIRDDIPPHCEDGSLPLKTLAPPGSGTRVRYRLTPRERGNGNFGNLHFWILGRLGLVWRRGEAPAEAVIKLYPGLSLAGDRKMMMWRPMAQEAMRAHRRTGVGTEFDSLREYVRGDDSRLIHWGTSARKGRLTVRQNRIERSQTIFLVLDAGRMMTARVLGKTKMDLALNAALLVAHSALQMGDKVGIMVMGQEVLSFVPPAKTPGHFGRMLDATYALEPRMEEPRFSLALSTIATRLKRRALVIILTELIDERASRGLLKYSLGLLPRHLPLVVAMSDTEVVKLADSTPTQEEDLYRQGVAANIIHRRELLLAKLAAARVMVLDAQPDQLSVNLLDRYLEIKTRSLL